MNEFGSMDVSYEVCGTELHARVCVVHVRLYTHDVCILYMCTHSYMSRSFLAIQSEAEVVPNGGTHLLLYFLLNLYDIIWEPSFEYMYVMFM